MESTRPQTRSIEDICAVNGHRGREVPPLSQNLVPNFSEIRKVFDTFFAPGLDHLLETGPTKWFALKAFDLLTGDRTLLAQFMLYLTFVSNTTAPTTSGTLPPEHAAVASQEARMVWSLLNLVVRQAQEGNDDDAARFAGRVKALEAYLTSEPVVKTSSMSDFVYQDPEPDTDIDMEGIPTVANNPILDKPFSKQLTARGEEFWQLVEKASEHPTAVPLEVLDRLRALLDRKEERDIVYSIVLLGSPPKPVEAQTADQDNGGESGRNSDSSSPNRAARRQEREQAARLLETEASGRANNVVLQNIAGIGLRAFVQ